MLNTVFEKETCGRCGGIGRYSYNPVDGYRCYGCGGRGEKYTKRGKAALAFFRNLNMKRADEVAIGDVIECSTFTGNAMATYYALVIEISEKLQRGATNGVPFEKMMVVLTTESRKFGKVGIQTNPDSLQYVRPATEKIRLARLDQALVYQASLTKTGAPRKR